MAERRTAAIQAAWDSRLPWLHKGEMDAIDVPSTRAELFRMLERAYDLGRKSMQSDLRELLGLGPVGLR